MLDDIGYSIMAASIALSSNVNAVLCGTSAGIMYWPADDFHFDDGVAVSVFTFDDEYMKRQRA